MSGSSRFPAVRPGKSRALRQTRFFTSTCPATVRNWSVRVAVGPTTWCSSRACASLLQRSKIDIAAILIDENDNRRKLEMIMTERDLVVRTARDLVQFVGAVGPGVGLIALIRGPVLNGHEYPGNSGRTACMGNHAANFHKRRIRGLVFDRPQSVNQVEQPSRRY